MTKDSYILVTPIKNEIRNIDALVKSVANQSIKPVLWIIVDDNSTDGSYEKLLQYEKRYEYLKVIKFPEKAEYDVGIHYSEVCKYGFDSIIKLCKDAGVDFDYIGLLDADIILENKYFEKLIKKLKEDSKIGVVSGEIYSWNGKKYVRESIRDDMPRGGARLWRKQCFFDTGGYLVSYSPDTVSNIKAIMRGWKIKKVKYAKAYQIRLTATAKGKYVGWKKEGVGAYYLYKPTILVFIKSLSLLLGGRIREAAGYFCGFFESYINKRPRINDKDVVVYNRKYDLKSVIDYWLRGGKNEEI